VLWLFVIVLFALCSSITSDVLAQEPTHDENSEVSSHRELDSETDRAADAHATTTEDHGDDHAIGAAAHHDPYDKSTANASDRLESVEEFRSDMAIATFLVFAILLAVLWKFAWGPISQALERREKGIADQLAEARRNNEEAHRLLDEHRARLDKAAQEVKGLMDEARRDGDTLRQRMISEAEQAATAQKDRALREIDAAKNGALEELARRSVDQAVVLAGRIVGRQLNHEDHAQLVQEALKQVPSKN
jgi:F-type H+-transporting ATPase subunit b